VVNSPIIIKHAKIEGTDISITSKYELQQWVQ
jgi:hypothetical protein